MREMRLCAIGTLVSTQLIRACIVPLPLISKSAWLCCVRMLSQDRPRLLCNTNKYIYVYDIIIRARIECTICASIRSTFNHPPVQKNFKPTHAGRATTTTRSYRKIYTYCACIVNSKDSSSSIDNLKTRNNSKARKTVIII